MLGRISSNQIPMQRLSMLLSRFERQTVIDQIGLSGNYEWTHRLDPSTDRKRLNRTGCWRCRHWPIHFHCRARAAWTSTGVTARPAGCACDRSRGTNADRELIRPRWIAMLRLEFTPGDWLTPKGGFGIPRHEHGRFMKPFIILLVATLAGGQTKTPSGVLGAGSSGGVTFSSTGTSLIIGGTPGQVQCGQVIIGAPYSALEVKDNVQTLADGTHITQPSERTMYYRDSQGRTRIDVYFTPPSPAAVSGDAGPNVIEIFDRVAGLWYSLDTRNHTARKNSLTANGAIVRTLLPAPPSPPPPVRLYIRQTSIRKPCHAGADRATPTARDFTRIIRNAGH